jgi:hypothetical protein
MFLLNEYETVQCSRVRVIVRFQQHGFTSGKCGYSSMRRRYRLTHLHCRVIAPRCYCSILVPVRVIGKYEVYPWMVQGRADPANTLCTHLQPPGCWHRVLCHRPSIVRVPSAAIPLSRCNGDNLRIQIPHPSALNAPCQIATDARKDRREIFIAESICLRVQLNECYRNQV